MQARCSASSSHSWCKNLLGFVLLLALFALPASAQEHPPTAHAPQQPPSAPSAKAPQHQPSGPISKQQEKELFHSVNQILQFASTDTGLPIRHPVKRKLITRQAVTKYVEDRMREDKDTQRLERSKAVLVKFGLLPPDYDLHREYLRLLQEQVAAFYDPKNKTVNLLDWVPPDQQKPVLAHELTHALQDQYVGLDKWQLAGGNENDTPLPDNQEQVVEEAQAAREAVAEGQAMIALLDYSMAPLGMSVLKAPEVVESVRAGMGDSSDSPIFSAAPMYLRESLVMPYSFGATFVSYVLQHKGKDAAFAGVLDKPPASTRQVMEPETYLKGEVIEPLKVPDLDQLVGSTYERYDFGGIGEFDVYLLAKLYAPEKDPKNYYANWRGGYYLVAHPKAAPSSEVALLYMSHWDSPEAAQQFAAAYENYVPNRYPRWSKQEGTPLTETTGDLSSWREGPESGRVQVLQDKSDLLILEGFDQGTADRLTTTLLHPGAARKVDTRAPAHSSVTN